MVITADRKLGKLDNNTFFCNFEEFNENIEFEIRLMENMLYIQYCDHIQFSYDYKNPNSIPIDIYLKCQNKFSPFRREIRNIREIIDYEENKDLLGKSYNMVNKAVQKLEGWFGIKDIDIYNHYYDFIFDGSTGKVTGTNFEVIKSNGCYKVITPDLKETELDSGSLAVFLEEKGITQLTDYANNPIDIKYIFEGDTSKTDDMKRGVA